jgi:GINS complex subunit 1
MRPLRNNRADMDLTTNTLPPKSLYITVRALEDCGEIVGEDGTAIRLERFSENLVRRHDVELLIKQGRVIEV